MPSIQEKGQSSDRRQQQDSKKSPRAPIPHSSFLFSPIQMSHVKGPHIRARAYLAVRTGQASTRPIPQATGCRHAQLGAAAIFQG